MTALPGLFRPDPPAPPEQHLCTQQGCTRWGSFGFGFGTGRAWFCREHLPGEERAYLAALRRAP